MAAKTKALGKKPGGLSDRASDVVLVVLSVVIMLLVAYPLYYILVASFSDPYDVYAGKTFLLPSQFTLDGYKRCSRTTASSSATGTASSTPSWARSSRWS